MIVHNARVSGGGRGVVGPQRARTHYVYTSPSFWIAPVPKG